MLAKIISVEYQNLKLFNYMQIKLLMLYSNTLNYLTVCQQMMNIK